MTNNQTCEVRAISVWLEFTHSFLETVSGGTEGHQAGDSHDSKLCDKVRREDKHCSTPANDSLQLGTRLLGDSEGRKVEGLRAGGSYRLQEKMRGEGIIYPHLPTHTLLLSTRLLGDGE